MISASTQLRSSDNEVLFDSPLMSRWLANDEHTNALAVSLAGRYVPCKCSHHVPVHRKLIIPHYLAHYLIDCSYILCWPTRLYNTSCIGPPVYIIIPHLGPPVYVINILSHPRPTGLFDIPFVGPPVYVIHSTSAHLYMEYTLHQPTRLCNIPLPRPTHICNTPTSARPSI